VTATLETDRNDAIPGTWYSTEVAEIPGATPGQSATVQLCAWYNDGGTVTTYAAAAAHGYPAGFSTTATVITGGPSAPANLPTFATGGVEFIFSSGPTSVIPEPSTLALAVMGASAFLLGFRRKR
jgi:hypothetical protein